MDLSAATYEITKVAMFAFGCAFLCGLAFGYCIFAPQGKKE